jgi:phenylalanyl-tRNA synthetase beta subunit
VAQILRSLQFGVTVDAEGFLVEVPSFRATKDIAIEDDLIE